MESPRPSHEASLQESFECGLTLDSPDSVLPDTLPVAVPLSGLELQEQIVDHLQFICDQWGEDAVTEALFLVLQKNPAK